MTSKYVLEGKLPSPLSSNVCGRPARRYEDIREHLIDQLNTCYVIANNGCWLWTGLRYSNGYGKLADYLPRTEFSHRAHRASYQLHKGPIPKGLFVLHSCDTKWCINPDHLHLGTHKDNMREAKERGLMKQHWSLEAHKARSEAMKGAGNPMWNGKGAQCHK